MKIWAIVGTVMSGGYVQHHWHYAATKMEAFAYIREYEWVDRPTIKKEDVPATRKGVCDALNDFIVQTCINE